MLQHILAIGAVARNQMEVKEGDRALSTRSANVHDRLQSRKRDTHIRGMRGDTVAACAENRMCAVDPVHCGAAGPRLALIARQRDIAEVGTASTLQKIAP